MWLKNSLFTNCDHNKSIYYHTFSTSSLLICIFKQLIKTALCKLNLPLHQQCGSGIYKDPKRPYCTSVTSGCTVNETTFWSRFKHTDGNCLEHRIEHASFSHTFFEIVPFFSDIFIKVISVIVLVIILSFFQELSVFPTPSLQTTQPSKGKTMLPSHFSLAYSCSIKTSL